MKTNNSPLRTITAKQAAWCAANNIEAFIDRDCGAAPGFTFWRNDTWVSFSDGSFEVGALDRDCEDGCHLEIASGLTLKAALAILVAA